MRMSEWSSDMCSSGLPRFGDEGEAQLDLRRGVPALQPPGDVGGDPRRRQLARRGQDPRTRLVELADDARAHVRAPVVELLLELVLDQRALLLDDEDLILPFREPATALALERPAHCPLVARAADVHPPFLWS